MPLRGGSKASHRISVRGLQVLAGLKYLNEQKNKVCVCVVCECVCVCARTHAHEPDCEGEKARPEYLIIRKES